MSDPYPFPRVIGEVPCSSCGRHVSEDEIATILLVVGEPKVYVTCLDCAPPSGLPLTS